VIQPPYSECTGEIVDPPPDPPARSETVAIGFWLALIIGLMIVEIVANTHGKRTPSQFLKRHTGKILKLIGVVGFFALGWHLFYGGPF